MQKNIDIKIAIIEEYKKGKGYRVLAKEYDISESTIKFWIQNYKIFGYEGLEKQKRLRKWKAEEKNTNSLRIFKWQNKYRRTKPVEEMTDIEKLQAENRLLKAQMRDKEVEMLLLKNCRNWKGAVADRSKAREFVFSH